MRTFFSLNIPVKIFLLVEFKNKLKFNILIDLSGKSFDDYVLTYLTFWVNKQETEYICGVLSVNIQGFPIEYRFTEPIVLDEAQKIFYGGSLKKYLISKVIGNKLINSLEDSPDFILVEDKEVQVIRDMVDIPVIWLESNDEETPSVYGDQDDVSAFNKIPKTLIQMDLFEPFLRLKNAIYYSITNE